MFDDRLAIDIDVTYDRTTGCYLGQHPRLAAPLRALSLHSLRAQARRALGGSADVRLVLDKAARRERAERRSGGAARASDTSGQAAG